MIPFGNVVRLLVASRNDKCDVSNVCFKVSAAVSKQKEVIIATAFRAWMLTKSHVKSWSFCPNMAEVNLAPF